MKHTKIMALLLCLCAILAFCGCQNKKDVERNETGGRVEDTIEFQPVEEINRETKLKIFYGDENAEKIISTEVVIEELNVNAVLMELMERRIVSDDTRVGTFMYGEKDGQKVLKLDMSKEFREYVSMMGSAGEYIIIGSLVDTFLTAFDAEKILIRIEGEVFETPHQSYENYLMFYQAE